MMADTQHFDWQTLQAFRDGTLPPERADAVEQHLASCSSCAAVLEDLNDGEITSGGLDDGQAVERTAAAPQVSSPDVVGGPVDPTGLWSPTDALVGNSAADAAGSEPRPGHTAPPFSEANAERQPADGDSSKQVANETLALNLGPTSPAVGDKVRYFGDYELLDEIARGGMGVVYKARQAKLNRIVALKMILAGQFASHDDVRRFYLEAEAAAKLEHPGIVPIYEVGQYGGQHFFSMGFVEGRSLAARVAEGPLPPRQAAELMQPITEAIAYAHSQGVVHRDLKPANVLLDAQGFPRVTDFGLAKHLESESGVTRSGAVMGTPSYMPPEQAAGDTAKAGPLADVYSLGATLYCLLTGRPPFQAANVADTLLQVMTAEPVPPRQLNPQIPVDLETIVLKCLEKDPARRYASAGALAEELGRYMRGEPIQARPISSVARGWRWCRRKPVVAGLMATVAATLLIGTAVAWSLASWALNEAKIAQEQTHTAQAAAAEAQRQQRFAEAVAGFLEDDFLGLTSVAGQMEWSGESSPANLSRETTLSELLDRAAEKLLQRTDLAPEIAARLYHVVGFNYLGNGDAEKGIPFLNKALELRQKHLGDDHSDTLKSMNSLAEGYHAAGQLDKALPLYEQTLAQRKAKLGADHPDTLTSMRCVATAYHSAGQLDNALPLYEEALALSKTKLGDDHPDTLKSVNNLAGGYYEAGQREKALPLLERTLALKQSKLGDDHPDTLHGMNNLAACYFAVGQREKALLLLEQTLTLRKAKLGDDHPDTLKSMHSLADGYREAGQYDKALVLYEQTLTLRKAKLGDDHPDTLGNMNSLAEGYRAAGQYDKALPMYEQTLTLSKAKLGDDHPGTLNSMSGLAEGYHAAGQFDKALPLYEQTLTLRKAKLGDDHPETLRSMANLAKGYAGADQHYKSVPLMEQTVALMKAKLGDDHPDTLISMTNLAAGYRTVGRLSEALPLYERTLARMQAKLGDEHPHTLSCMNNLAVAYHAAGQLDKALPLYERTLELMQAKLGDDHPYTLRSMISLAGTYWFRKQLDRSVPLFEEALRRHEAKLGRDHPDTLFMIANLGVNYLDAGRPEAAIPLLEEAAEQIPKYPRLGWVRRRLATAYRKAKAAAEAVAPDDDPLSF